MENRQAIAMTNTISIFVWRFFVMSRHSFLNKFFFFSVLSRLSKPLTPNPQMEFVYTMKRAWELLACSESSQAHMSIL